MVDLETLQIRTEQRNGGERAIAEAVQGQGREADARPENCAEVRFIETDKKFFSRAREVL